MKHTIFIFSFLAIILAGCNNEHAASKHDEHDEAKFQYTAYSNEFELFAEADPFVVGKTSNVLSHFSNLPGFKALEKGSITIHLIINGKESIQTLEKPTRKGIYSFDLKPETAGVGKLLFDIKTETGNYQVTVPNITVYATEEEADQAVEKAVLSKTNTTVFTKEQSWKIDFATELPKKEAFGQVIKTTAMVQSSQGDEILLSAKSNGIVVLSNDFILEGKSVTAGQTLFTISGSGMTDNNPAVKFAEAQNNYEKAKSDYNRIKELAKDKIVSEKELVDSKNKYENAKLNYENLSKNFSASGQRVSSSINGYVKQVFIKNGQFVETGQPIVSISQNKTLLLHADVQQKYASILGYINSAVIHTMHDKQMYTLEQLNGKILSFGRSANNDNYLISVSIEIDNKADFVPGSFVEVYLKTLTNTQALTIPNSAISEDQGIYFVFVQITPELFEKREVKPGATDGLKTEILNGITESERIVTKGAILIKLAQATGTLDAHSGHVH